MKRSIKTQAMIIVVAGIVVAGSCKKSDSRPDPLLASLATLSQQEVASVSVYKYDNLTPIFLDRREWGPLLEELRHVQPAAAPEVGRLAPSAQPPGSWDVIQVVQVNLQKGGFYKITLSKKPQAPERVVAFIYSATDQWFNAYKGDALWKWLQQVLGRTSSER